MRGRMIPTAVLRAPVVPLLVVAALKRCAPAAGEPVTRADPRVRDATVARDARGEELVRYHTGAPLSSAVPAVHVATSADTIRARLAATSWACVRCTHPIADACAAVLVSGTTAALHASCAADVLAHPEHAPTLHRRLLYGDER